MSEHPGATSVSKQVHPLPITAAHGAEAAHRHGTMISRLGAGADGMIDGIVVVGEDGGIAQINSQFKRLWGISEEVAAGHRFVSVVSEMARLVERADHFVDQFKPGSGSEAGPIERDILLSDGRVYEQRSHAVQIDGQVVGRVWSYRDITDNRLAVQERDTTIELLNLLNRCTQRKELANCIAEFLKRRFGFEIVAVRLQEGDDFPYAAEDGLPAEFLASENHLCIVDCMGQVVREPSGQAKLACLCGRVIRGQTDSSRPYFTPFGSLRVNSVSDLLKTTPMAELGDDIRGRCAREGFESLALVPLKIAGGSLGLLQFADHRPGMLGAQRMGLIERIAGYVAMAVARIRAEEAQRASHASVRALLDAIPEAAMLLTPRGIVVEANNEIARRLGTTIEGLVGRDIMSRIPIESGSKRAAVFEEVLKTGLPQRLIDCQQGRDFEVYYNPVIGPDGRVSQVAVLGIDITERKRAEAELARNELRLQRIVESNMLGISISEPDTGKINQANDKFLQIVGRTRKELETVGLNWREMTPPEWIVVDDREIEKCRQSGASTPYEKEYLRPDGTRVPVMLGGAFIEPGKPECVVFVLDLTEQKQTEAALRASARLAATGQMAARIAHEVNNPLAGIKNSFLLIRDAIPREHRYFSFVERIEKEIDRIGSIVRQMYTLHRPDPPKIIVFDLKQMIDEVMDLVRHGLRKAVAILIQSTDMPMLVRLPEGPMRQVLFNVLNNAVDASPAGGTVTIRVDCGEELAIAITDQGQGISPEAQQHLFDPFFSTKDGTEGGGMGLGLSVSRSLVEAVGGEIEFENQAGGGVTFVVRLPASCIQRKTS